MTAFVVVRVEAIPTHLHGYLERFLQEIRTGLFVGMMTTRTSEELWKVLHANAANGDIVMIIPRKNVENGYIIRHTPHKRWESNDFDGLQLFTRIHDNREKPTQSSP